MSSGPEADWYLDPTGRNRNRYWDGRMWTERAGSNWLEIADPLSTQPEPPSEEAPKRSVLESLRLKAPKSNATPGRYAGDEILMSGPVTHVVSGRFVRAMLTATSRDVLLDETGTKSGRTPMLGFPINTVTSITVDEWSAARSEYGWKIATGFLHGPTRISATSAVSFDLQCGEHVLLRFMGEPVLVRSNFRQLIALVEEHRPPMTPSDHEGDPYDRLRKLAQLREDGILTEDEFAAEKAKILGT